MFLELSYAGGMQLEKIGINTNYISAIEKRNNDKFGCIIVMTNGDKFPVKELYDDVLKIVK